MPSKASTPHPGLCGMQRSAHTKLQVPVPVAVWYPDSFVACGQVFLDGTHRASEYDWLIGYPDVFGACFFFWPGVWLLVVENANTDLEMRRHNWEASGRKGKRPG